MFLQYHQDQVYSRIYIHQENIQIDQNLSDTWNRYGLYRDTVWEIRLIKRSLFVSLAALLEILWDGTKGKFTGQKQRRDKKITSFFSEIFKILLIFYASCWILADNLIIWKNKNFDFLTYVTPQATHECPQIILAYSIQPSRLAGQRNICIYECLALLYR